MSGMKGDEERNEADARCEAARGVWFEGRESRRTYLIKTLVYIGSTLLLALGGLLIGGRRDGGGSGVRVSGRPSCQGQGQGLIRA